MRLRCTLRTRPAAPPPPISGPLLEATFRRALRRAVCNQTAEPPACESCQRRRHCAYARLLEPHLDGGEPPFVLELGAVVDEDRAGSSLIFDVVLSGEAVELQAHVVVAVGRMAKAGLGERRQPFELQRVEYRAGEAEWRDGFVGGERRWHQVAGA